MHVRLVEFPPRSTCNSTRKSSASWTLPFLEFVRTIGSAIHRPMPTVPFRSSLVPSPSSSIASSPPTLPSREKTLHFPLGNPALGRPHSDSVLLNMYRLPGRDWMTNPRSIPSLRTEGRRGGSLGLSQTGPNGCEIHNCVERSATSGYGASRDGVGDGGKPPWFCDS